MKLWQWSFGTIVMGLFFASGMPSAMAQDETGARTKPEPAETATPPPRTFEELDANDDGAIGKDEAAVDPALVQMFGTLDKDADGRLTPDEYAVHARGAP